MKLAKKVLIFLVSSIFLFVWLARPIKGEICQDLSLQQRIGCLTDEVNRLSEQSKTLSNQIAQFDAQIYLTTLKIQDTEAKIKLLGGRIDQLEVSLTALSGAFAQRAVETYKMARVGDPVLLLVSAPNLGEAVSRFHYLERIQEADRDLMQKLQSAQTTYKGQKADQETLQTTLNQQKADLNNQKAAKAYLLQVTQNDEAKYQQLLAEAQAELAAVQGLGTETFIRDVSEGERIGNIIVGRSGCSTGTHLHFQVDQGNNYEDPNNYLMPISFSYDYGQDQYGEYGQISPHGSWRWPIDQPVVIEQGFGPTGYGQIAYKYSTGGIHTGIDMRSSSNNNVYAVKSGKLYGGSVECKGALAGTLLYAKIDQGDGITTWYLHMIPQ